jgi:hypothetical protein
MGLSHSPRIVTDGLVFCVDAGDKMSYPGAGTTWTDLSKNRNNGTLTNGPTFDSANGGSIVFDGTNDTVICTNNNLGDKFDLNQPHTFMFWINKLSSSRGRGILRVENSSGDLALQVLFNKEGGSANIAWLPFHTSGSASESDTASSSFSLNKWQHLCFRHTGNTVTANMQWYVNTEEVSYRSRYAGAYSSSARTLDGEIKIGDSEWNNRFLDGSLANMLLYNRRLTPDEIRQNYNATRGRFQ